MQGRYRYLLVALVAFCAALAASWAGQRLGQPHHAGEGGLHALVHERLDLDATQRTRIDALEAQFAQRRRALDEQLREANTQLAEAIRTEHQYGPKVAEAVDRSHMAMGELQKATLAHVFAMRAVLRPDQAARFDEEVARALTRPDRANHPDHQP